jgi:hypothetical protein
MSRWTPTFRRRRTRAPLSLALPGLGRIVAIQVPKLVFLAVFGPGLVSGFADNDAGGITTYSVVGGARGERVNEMRGGSDRRRFPEWRLPARLPASRCCSHDGVDVVSLRCEFDGANHNPAAVRELDPLADSRSVRQVDAQFPRVASGVDDESDQQRHDEESTRDLAQARGAAVSLVPAGLLRGLDPGEPLDGVRATLFHFVAKLLAADVAVVQEREPEVAASDLSLELCGNAHCCPPWCRGCGWRIQHMCKAARWPGTRPLSARPGDDECEQHVASDRSKRTGCSPRRRSPELLSVPTSWVRESTRAPGRCRTSSSGGTGGIGVRRSRRG